MLHDTKHQNDQSRSFNKDNSESLKEKRKKYAINRERLWINYPPFLRKVEYYEWLATAPPRRRERVIPLIGAPNSGKTAIIETYLRRNPERWEQGSRVIPAIHLTMSDYRRVEDVSIDLLKAFKLPDASDDPDRKSGQTHRQRMERFYRIAPEIGLQLVFLDEFHDVANLIGRGKGLPFIQLIKAMLLNKIRVIPVGTFELERLLNFDDQIKSRFAYDGQPVPAVTDPQVVRVCMQQISELTADRISDAAVNFVLRECSGHIGLVLDLIENTIVNHGNLQITSLQLELYKLVR